MIEQLLRCGLIVFLIIHGEKRVRCDDDVVAGVDDDDSQELNIFIDSTGDNSSSNLSTQMPELNVKSVLILASALVLLVILIFAICSAFFSAQNNTRMDDSKRLDRLVKKLTKRAIRKMEVSRAVEGEKPEQSCTICLDTFNPGDIIQKLPCNHTFHKKEIDTWLLENPICPICKLDVLKAYNFDDVSVDDPVNRFMIFIGLSDPSPNLNQLMHSLRRDSYSNYCPPPASDQSPPSSFLPFHNHSMLSSIDTNDHEEEDIIQQFQRVQMQRYGAGKPPVASAGFFGERGTSGSSDQEDMDTLEVIIQDDRLGIITKHRSTERIV